MTAIGVVTIAGSIGGVASAASDLASAIGGPQAGSWEASLRQASYGGVPFGIEGTRTRGGRRNAIHDYPFRDEVWVEDLGKLPRQFNLIGFLIENSLVYGGGPVIGQRDRMFDVCEAAGPQTLVHPTFGTIQNVNCLNVDFTERKEMGRVIEVTFTFLQSGPRIFPSATNSTAGAVSSAASALGVSSLVDFVKKTSSAIQAGAAVVRSAVGTAVGFYQLGTTVVNDVKRFWGSVSTLEGNFGRLFGGGNSGYAGTNQKAPAGTTVSSLIASDTAARAVVVSTGAALQTAAASVSNTSAFGAATQAFVSAVSASAADPSDAIRMLSSMAGFSPAAASSSQQAGASIVAMQSACAALFRRAAIAQLAQQATQYQPASQDDAESLMTTLVAVFDGEIEIAGDTGDDASYLALRALRQAVVADLQTRGASLAAVATFNFNSSLPALALANRIYRDASRSDGLVQQANPIHPAFLPTTFRALST